MSKPHVNEHRQAFEKINELLMGVDVYSPDISAWMSDDGELEFEVPFWTQSTCRSRGTLHLSIAQGGRVAYVLALKDGDTETGVYRGVLGNGQPQNAPQSR